MDRTARSSYIDPTESVWTLDSLGHLPWLAVYWLVGQAGRGLGPYRACQVDLLVSNPCRATVQ